MEEYKDSLYYSIYRIVLQEHIAEELFQETWLKAIERRHTYDTSRSFAPWLFRIARNLCFDHLRSRKRHQEKEYLAVSENPTGDVDFLPQEEEKVNVCLQHIPPKYRDVIHFRFYEELSLQEISYIIKRPVGTVKSRINRGLKSLKGAWETHA